MKRFLILSLGSFGVSILAILVGWWLVSRPSDLDLDQNQSAAIPNCENYPDRPDRDYCNRDLSAIALPSCDRLSVSEFQLECRWREAIIARDPVSCENLAADRRDLCLWDVSVVRHAYAGRPSPPDFSLCDRIRRSDIRDNCRTRSYAMEEAG